MSNNIDRIAKLLIDGRFYKAKKLLDNIEEYQTLGNKLAIAYATEYCYRELNLTKDSKWVESLRTIDELKDLAVESLNSELF